MSIKNKLIVVFFSMVNLVQAQLYKSHKWEKEPIFYQISQEEETLASVAIKEKHLVQYYKPVLGNTFKLFETKHSIIRVNSEKGVNKHNRVYIPMRGVRRVIDIQARVLSADGKIKLLNKKNIKELQNVKGYGNFKIFAIEGVTKKSQLEFIYTLEKEIRAVGSVVAQKDYKVKKAEFILRKPTILNSDVKPYNGFPKLTVNVVEGNKKAMTATIYDIPAMIDEESATPNANRMKVSYVVRNGQSYAMWDNLKDGLKRNFVNVKARKINKLISDYEKFAAEENDLNQVNKICEYVHRNYNILRNNSAPEYDDLNVIFSKKQASEQGIVKLFVAILNYYKIPYDLVLSSNRYNHKFDESFYSNANLQELLIYFPETEKFINPSSVNSRLDYAPFQYISNKGFFLEDRNYRFRNIESPNADYTMTIRDFELNINNDGIGEVTCRQDLTGYKASMMRGAHKFFQKKDYNEFKNIMATSGLEDAEISSFEVSNEDLNLITENIPFISNWTYTAESLVEQAGNDLLFNIGKAIGRQVEFYQEVERVNPVEIQFPNKYVYNFKIAIPEGYRAKGLEDFNIDERVMIDNKEACSFKSSYEIDGNTILIVATEDYNLLRMDVEQYDGYKKVVNSAFDFSKKAILFEKE